MKSSIQDITEGEEDECEQLMYALILSGLAMQMIGNSRPASCAEHQVTHLWDMEVINGPLDALHGGVEGFQVDCDVSVLFHLLCLRFLLRSALMTFHWSF